LTCATTALFYPLMKKANTAGIKKMELMNAEIAETTINS
jgi:hypothetical protein